MLIVCNGTSVGNVELLKEKVRKHVFVKSRYYKVQTVWFKIEKVRIKLEKKKLRTVSN